MIQWRANESSFAGSLNLVAFLCELKTVISSQCNYILNYLVFDDIVKHRIHLTFDVQILKAILIVI